MTLAKKFREVGFEKLTVLFYSFLRQKVAPQPVVADRQKVWLQLRGLLQVIQQTSSKAPNLG